MSTATEGARDGLTSVTRGTSIMLLGTFGWVAENFFSKVVLTHTLLPVDFGRFSLGLALAGLLATLGALGLPAAIARSLPFASGDDERRGILRVAFTVGIPAAVGASAVLVLLGFPIGGGDPVFGLTLELFGFSLVFSLLSVLLASIFQGYENVYPNALFVQILAPSLFLGAIVVLLALPAYGITMVSVLVSYVVANAVALAALGVYSRRRLRRMLPPGPVAPGAGRKLLIFALPLFAVGIFTYITQNGDTLILGVFDRPLIQFYSTPLALGRLLQVGLGSLAYIFLPVTARFIRLGNREAVRITYTTATKWTVLTSLPPFLVFFFLPARSLSFVFGSTYSGATATLEILVAGAFLSTLVGPAVAAQVSFGRTRLLMYNSAAAAAADVVLSWLLIPSLALVGAAIAWSVANALFTVLPAVELALLDGVHPFRRHYLLPMLVTSAPLAALFAFVPVPLPFWVLPLLVLGIAVLYTLAVVFTGSVDEGDRLLLEVVEQFLGRRLPLVRRLAGWGGAGPRERPD